MVSWKYMKYDDGAFDYEDDVSNYAEDLKAQGLKFSYEPIVTIHHNGGYKTSVVTGADFIVESEGQRLLEFHSDQFVYCSNCNRYDSDCCSSCGAQDASDGAFVEHSHFLMVNGGMPVYIGEGDCFSCPIVNSVKKWVSDSFSGQSIIQVIGNFCVIEAKLSRCQIHLTCPQDNDTRIEVLFEPDHDLTGFGYYERDFVIDPADPSLFDILQSLIGGTYFQGGNRACTGSL